MPAPRPMPPLVQPADDLARLAERTFARLATFLRQAGAGEVSDLLDVGAIAGDIPEPEPLRRLIDGLSLQPFDVDLLLLAALGDEQARYGEVLRRVHPRSLPYATVSLATLVLDPEGHMLREALETGAAARTGLIRCSTDGALAERSIVPAERIWSVLRGLDVWPEASGHVQGEPTLAGLDRWLAAADAEQAVLALRANERTTVLVTAEDERAGQERAAALVQVAGRLGAKLVPGQTPDWELLVTPHLAARGAVPILRISQPDGVGAPASPDFPHLNGPVVVAARPGVFRPATRPVISVEARPLRAAERRHMWRQIVPELAGESAALAARFAVEPAVAAGATMDARAASARRGQPVAIADVAAGVRARTAVGSVSGIRVVRPVAGWDSLVLPRDRIAHLREVVQRLERQAEVLDDWGFLEGRAGARGVRVLLSGPPGTGKTLSAEVLARSLDVDLLIVDLSRVVSKWLGETEKNLARVFDAAEQSTAVLLFDEADALFAKRTKVSDAHDRYANLETAYLLSRLERFDGLAILSTNLRHEIDVAFTRRLDVIVEYSAPDAEQRALLWRRHIPPHAPLADGFDFKELAQTFPVVGGVIRNAALAAAFLASSEGTPIRRDHFFHAMRREYDKMAQQFPRVDYKPL